jgi:hypothetical protein
MAARSGGLPPVFAASTAARCASVFAVFAACSASAISPRVAAHRFAIASNAAMAFATVGGGAGGVGKLVLACGWLLGHAWLSSLGGRRDRARCAFDGTAQLGADAAVLALGEVAELVEQSGAILAVTTIRFVFVAAFIVRQRHGYTRRFSGG